MGRHRLINKQNIRRFILEHAERTRAHRFTRVADGVYHQIELAIRDKCRDIVRTQPSAGRTIR